MTDKTRIVEVVHDVKVWMNENISVHHSKLYEC